MIHTSKKGQLLVIWVLEMIKPSESVIFSMKWGCRGHWDHWGCWGHWGHWCCRSFKAWKFTTEDSRVIQEFIFVFWKKVFLGSNNFPAFEFSWKLRVTSSNQNKLLKEIGLYPYFFPNWMKIIWVFVKYFYFVSSWIKEKLLLVQVHLTDLNNRWSQIQTVDNTP